jgi:hypothetical protein
MLERAYSCIVKNGEGQDCCVRTIHAFSDNIAIERASLFFDQDACDKGRRLELWRGDEMVYTEQELDGWRL